MIRDQVLLCFAVKEEAVFARHLAPHLIITGMGNHNARNATEQALTSWQPSHVLTCGFAGGLNPACQIGDVLYQVSQAPELEEALSNAGACKARFTTTPRVLVTAKEKQTLHRTTQADAVEMESATIRALCQERGLPCATIRVISDTADEDLPLDFNQFMDPHSQLRLSRLLMGILRQPQSIPGLLRLQKHTRLAARKLAAVLEQILR